ncbi:MAG: ABC transporter substrate-binding protein, partial [Gammaproteobacteria bacterium]|nr:ABC transporter substrate-binding protein [Gammaproteobacteria bacterium]
PVDYRLIQSGESWKVYDVVIDGMSLVSNYRSSFSGEIRRSGIDGLIKSLQNHNGEG